jgi:heterodisulfide reductase subunit A
MQVNYEDENGEKKTQPVDMVILSQAMIPRPDSAELAERLGIQREERGFLATLNTSLSPVETGKEGIYVVGCAGGPMDIPESVAQAEAAVGKVLHSGMDRIGEQAGDSQ